MYSPTLFPLSQSCCVSVLAKVLSSAKSADLCPSDESSNRTISRGRAAVNGCVNCKANDKPLNSMKFQKLYSKQINLTLDKFRKVQASNQLTISDLILK